MVNLNFSNFTLASIIRLHFTLLTVLSFAVVQSFLCISLNAVSDILTLFILILIVIYIYVYNNV